MKTLFKKSLVALALTGAAMSAQAAINVTGVAQYANEGISKATGAAQNITLGLTAGTEDVIVTVNTAVPQNGLIRVNFSVPVSTKSGFVMDLSNVAAATLTTGGAATLAVANYGADFVVYRVTGAALGLGDTITFDNSLRFVSSQIVAAGGLSVTASSETNLGASIEGAVTTKVVEIVEQFEFEVQTAGLLSKTIDVAKQRTAFTAGTTAALTVTTTDNSGVTDAFEVAYTAQKYTLEGDFSFLKDTDATTTGIQSDAIAYSAGCQEVSVTATALKFNCNGTAANPTVTFDITANTASKPDVDVATVLNETAFKLTGEADYNNPAGLASNIKETFKAAAVGSWTLNGSNVQVPYMVFGTVGGKEFSQIININNSSSIEGAIYVDIYAADGTMIAKNKKLTAVAKANSVTSIAGEVKALVGTYAGRAAVRVIAEVPAATTQVYAAYVDNVTTERAIVVGIK